MPRISHAYQDRHSLERLLLLIATFAKYPGIGCADPLNPKSQGHHEALAEVRDRLFHLAQALDIERPNCAIATLRKDLETLRRYGILERRMYRWGYYLGTGALNLDELQVALQAIAAISEHQGDPKVRLIYDTLTRRLRGLNLQREELFYPVRTLLNRVIVYSDPAEMMEKGMYRHSLFHQLDALEAAIVQGQAVELFCDRNPYEPSEVGFVQVYPLQLLYADVAWYLLVEHCSSQHLELVRVDRFRDVLTVLPQHARGLEAQRQQLKAAHNLLQAGWGLNLGTPAEQKAERSGNLDFVEAKVRFFGDVVAFIAEGEKRHPRQTLRKGPQGSIDYGVWLPPRSLPEFSRWVNRFMDAAKAISPTQLVEQHRSAAQRLAERYSDMND
jgi:WYL domain